MAGQAISNGHKYRTRTGGYAIKNGMKTSPSRPRNPDGPKPPWLKVRIPAGTRYRKIHKIVHDKGLATVCEESHCPNIAECWNHGTATLMLMGSVCTRACRFCAVDTGNPKGWLDPGEPAKTAEAVHAMKLRYVVLTSVDRDDLPDGGAGHYAACVRTIKARNPDTAVEVLTPDFQGDLAALETVLGAAPEVYAQNLETVERLTEQVRDPRAGYGQTLGVLESAKKIRPEILTKTSLILGLGEKSDEIRAAMRDLRAIDCDVLTLGQYLRPTVNHLPVARWISPQEFEQWRHYGLEQGFVEVAAGPLVRSSYRADRVLERNNLGLSDPESSVRKVPLLDLLAQGNS